MPRPKGVPNKITSLLRGDIYYTYRKIGARKWLEKLSETHPEQFVKLVGKIFPDMVEHSGDVTVGTTVKFISNLKIDDQEKR